MAASQPQTTPLTDDGEVKMQHEKDDLSDLPDTVIQELAPARVRKAAEAARNKDNAMLVDRIKGIAATPGTPETDADPHNPNV